MASETRESLKPFVNKRITIRGLLDAFDDWTHNRFPSRRACIRNPEMDGEVIGSHVWVVHVKHWRQFEERVGEQVKFTATVSAYVGKDSKTNYCLTNADEPEFIHAPALLVPPEREEAPQPTLPPEPTNGTPIPAVPEPKRNPIEQMRWVRRFVKACGSEDRAEAVAAFLASEAAAMEPSELVRWVAAMREE